MRQDVECPYCSSKLIVKAGLRKLKRQVVQKFKCNSCLRYFTARKIKKAEYPERIILSSISTYNLGYTLEQTQKQIAKRFKLKVPLSTIHSWIKEYASICTFTRLRKNVLKLFSQDSIIFSQKLQHNQIYNFQLHRAKLWLQAKELPEQKFQSLRKYLETIPTNEFPHHIFRIPDEELEKRASQLKANLLKVSKLQKQNLANKLAELGLILTKTNKERHQAIQNFMLINDSVTIACEVPVYLTRNDIAYFKRTGFTFDIENYKTPITGHIDVLQIRNGLIHILDYKPNASKVNAITQLTIYALALSSRTKLLLKDFKCAWFDEKSYFEFNPLHAVYRKF